MFRTIEIGAMFILAHYLQHLDLSVLTIKSHLIQKQQDSLTSYFLSQKDGVLIYSDDATAKGVAFSN
jgi:hypothetical protein